ncbi:hypothetical protein ACH4TE_35330 [Streptomyces sioyaensis]|uniref:hypothetical protein n=1 Tax=Streptomyces sioyaensis TaxID=67364 RepID=UPI003791C853
MSPVPTRSKDSGTQDLAAHASAEITTQANRARLRGAKREAADICVSYLTGHLDQLGYNTALASDWPIATGMIEGACRHLIGDRLDSAGRNGALRQPVGGVPTSGLAGAADYAALQAGDRPRCRIGQ